MINNPSVNFKKGYTTGTCAQAAAKGACMMLAYKNIIEKVQVKTPSGVNLDISLKDQELGKNFAKCAVIKCSGDDPDATDGVKIYVEARLSRKKGVTIKGAEGIGKITKPGLAMGIGQWAINPTPRKMILMEVANFLPKESLELTITVPGGEELAKKTFNPKLGIVGGISIIGTTGIVEPRSLAAYKTSLALELNVLAALGHKNIVFILGYVGDKFYKEKLKLTEDSVIKIGDHIGFMLEQCAQKNIKKVLLIGHIGKLIKIANGQFNTHNDFGDNRISSIAQYAKLGKASKNVVREILKQTTAEACIQILKKVGLMPIFDKIAEDVSKRAEELVKHKVKLNCIILSLEGEMLAKRIR